MMSSKKIFIDAGFLDSQILWILPIVDGYCKSLGINQIVFQRELSKDLQNEIYIQSFFKKYKIYYLENKKNRLIFKLIIFCLSIIVFPFLFIFNSRKSLLKNKNWFQTQVQHALWDTSLSFNKDGELSRGPIVLFKSSFLILYNLFLVTILKKSHDLHSCFLSHSVYQGRIFLASLRSNTITFCQSAFNLYKQPKKFDESWSILKNTKTLKLLLKKISNHETKKYWINRISGKGKYYESNFINKFKNKDLKKNINVLMLHVFRDSSFNFIDNNRIFSDYIDWVYTTLKILKNSTDKWYIRYHPFASRWGENSSEFINEIFRKLEIEPNKFEILNNEISNNLIFKNAKKIVTYSGTAFIEFASYGKKAIIISDVMPRKLQNILAIKPKSLEVYKKLLLNNIKKSNLSLSNKEVNLAKKLIYCRENITNLSTDTGGYFIYRNDKISTRKQEYKNVKQKVKNNSAFFMYLGKKFTKKNFTHSISSKFIDKIFK